MLIGKTEEAIGPYELKFIGVLPRYRGNNWAALLINTALELLDGPLWLNVMETNVYAIRIYEFMNFQVARRFKGETGEFGITYIINLKCYHCTVKLSPDRVILEEYPVGIEMLPYGPKQIMKMIRVCRRCATKVEP